MSQPGKQSDRAGRGRTASRAATVALASVLLALAFVRPATALVKFDFEQKYYVHPGMQVWDFCLVKPDSLFHIFYHGIPESNPYATAADTIWHATSPDLSHWTDPSPALSVGPDSWESAAVWAPDVIHDPALDRWTMLYTGVDGLKVQRLCAAHSLDLVNWTKEPTNPVFVPDSLQYYWSPTTIWSSCRDPFVYHADGLWNMLSTTALRNGGYPGSKQGAVHRTTSNDLVDWTDDGVIFVHDGDVRWHDLESAQYFQRGDFHHLLFAEYDVVGVSHVVSSVFGAWSMDDRQIIDWGGAPELDRFDGDVDIFSRLARTQDPQTLDLHYVVRFDTMTFTLADSLPVISPPHPLDQHWAVHSGSSALGNPTFGDNTAARGEESCGLVGNGWFGSQEYFQGPLSERGSPGTHLGDLATGELISHPFILTGAAIRLLVGGGRYPETCYVALVDAAADTILFSETGDDSETMTPRYWDVGSLAGREVYIRILDSETGDFGHINVDEIEELEAPTEVPSTRAAHRLIDHGPFPNPCNPATTFRFTVRDAGHLVVCIHDLRGREVWRSTPRQVAPGETGMTWRGGDRDGRSLSTGVYVYRVMLDGQRVAGGKISLIK